MTHEEIAAAPRFKTRVLEGGGTFLVTSPYGWRIHPITGERRFHAGIDGALLRGDALVECDICAWDDGVVAEAHGADDNAAGVFVAIDHGGGLVTKYFHLEEGTLRVATGDRVARGQPLGYMGKTGRATGEHLHFQAERDGVPIDPVPILGKAEN
ncbi:MAG: M23 family metallopeptidase [Kiritimatiellae bacterium]|nr:M23 family metallopeptidase [Kiritimatiellia bacterium]